VAADVVVVAAVVVADAGVRVAQEAGVAGDQAEDRAVRVVDATAAAADPAAAKPSRAREGRTSSRT
jgi:hypothetical protein